MDETGNTPKKAEKGIASASEKFSRREALEKLAQLSAYAAPTVTTLLTPKVSYALGSGISGTPNDNPSECTYNGAHTEVGADIATNEVQGDVANDNNFPLYLNRGNEHDWYGGGSDHSMYWSTFYSDSSTDCGQ